MTLLHISSLISPKAAPVFFCAGDLFGCAGGGQTSHKKARLVSHLTGSEAEAGTATKRGPINRDIHFTRDAPSLALRAKSYASFILK